MFRVFIKLLGSRLFCPPFFPLIMDISTPTLLFHHPFFRIFPVRDAAPSVGRENCTIVLSLSHSNVVVFIVKYTWNYFPFLYASLPPSELQIKVFDAGIENMRRNRLMLT